MAYDLSTYEGRQQARDAGNWVGADSSGNIVMEPSSGGGGGTTSTSTSSGGGGGTSAPASSGATVYQTVNGPRTAAQMGAELMQAGWEGATFGDQANVDQQIADAYARTAGGSVTPTSAGAPGAPGAPGTPGAPGLPDQNTSYMDWQNYWAKISQAQADATRAYNYAMLNLEGEKLAFQKAQQAFSESLSRAQMTGTFEGQPTQAAQLQQANLLGTYQGQQTLASQKQAADIAAQQAGLSGLFQGAPTLAAQGQYFNQGLAEQTQQQKVVQDYLTLLASLRGPQDYGQYLRVMASSPEGLRGLVNAAAGNQGRVPAFGTTGAPTQGATLGGFMGQAGAGGAAPGTGGTSYADYQAAAQALPPPSQIAPQNWNAMSDSQRKVLLSMYEANGWNVNDAMSQYSASLPKFGSATPQSGQFKLV